MDKLSNWLRWLLFFPASIIALFVVYPLIKIGNYFFSPDGDSLLTQIYAVVVGAGFTGYAFVWVAVKVVPKHQFVVSIVMTTIYAFLAGVTLSGKLILGDRSSTAWFEVLASVIIGTLGAIIACYQTYESFSNRSKDTDNYWAHNQYDFSGSDWENEENEEIEDESKYSISDSKTVGGVKLTELQNENDNLIRFKCSACATKYSAKIEQAGKKGICKKCGSEIVVPLRNDHNRHIF